MAPLFAGSGSLLPGDDTAAESARLVAPVDDESQPDPAPNGELR